MWFLVFVKYKITIPFFPCFNKCGMILPQWLLPIFMGSLELKDKSTDPAQENAKNKEGTPSFLYIYIATWS